MKGKSERQSVIRSLVRRENIANQEELQSLLEKEGFIVAQATLSRDLKELGIIKVHDGTDYLFRLQATATNAPTTQINMSSSVLSVQFSGNLAVLKTHPGHASMVASFLDTGAMVQIIGTIAGDDTVLAILRERTPQDAVLNGLSNLFPDIRSKYIR